MALIRITSVERMRIGRIGQIYCGLLLLLIRNLHPRFDTDCDLEDTSSPSETSMEQEFKPKKNFKNNFEKYIFTQKFD
jgi:hypothetical protein